MKSKSKNVKGIALAILAAALYAINAPFSKILLNVIPPTIMAGLLYLGAGIGMLFIYFIRTIQHNNTKENSLSRKDLPFTVLMIVLDIAAPIFLMLGLVSTSAANASLLNNFEIVVTAIIALCIFKEFISKRLWVGIIFITLSCGILTFEDSSAISFSYGSLFILLACVCWGFENNCTRKISSKDPLQIVLLKGIFSGSASLIIGLALGERVNDILYIFVALVLGLIAYGLSIYFYIYAQRNIGAAKTSAYYAIAPFIGTFISLIIALEIPTSNFYIALIFMAIGAYLAR